MAVPAIDKACGGMVEWNRMSLKGEDTQEVREMDVFIEKLIKRRKSPADVAYMFLLLFIAFGISHFVFLFISGLAPLIIAGLMFLTYYLISMRNIEYEYIVTNGDIDIDMIVNQRKRKRVFTANCKDFEVVARVNSDQYTKQIRETKNVLNFTSRNSNADVWFIYLIQNGMPMVILFEPDERMIDGFRTFIPRKVFK